MYYHKPLICKIVNSPSDCLLFHIADARIIVTDQYLTSYQFCIDSI